MKNLFVIFLILFIPNIILADCPDANFFVKSDKVTMLEFGAKFCTGCFQMESVIKRVKEELSDKVKVVFVDVDRCADIAEKMDIKLVPAQIFIDKNGKVFFRHFDFLSFDEIKEVLKNEKSL